MKAQTFSTLWLVAVYVTWTMLHETAEPFELKRFTANDSVAESERNELPLNQTGSGEEANPSENDNVETEISREMNATNNHDVAESELGGQNSDHNLQCGSR